MVSSGWRRASAAGILVVRVWPGRTGARRVAE